jgi:MoxR-like ATPase
MVTTAVKMGGILLIDEAFRSPALMSIQSLLERDGTLTLPDAASLTPEQRHLVPPAGQFWLVLTDNTNGTGDDTGAYNAEVQDLSTLDRITAAIYVSYISLDDERAILSGMFPAIPARVIEQVTEWARTMRAAFTSGSGIMQPVSLRATQAILRKYAITGQLATAVMLGYGNKLSKSDLVVAATAWQQVTATDLLS